VRAEGKRQKVSTAIRVRGLGKRYRLGRRESYGSLRDSVARAAAAPLNWLRRRAQSEQRSSTEWIDALQGVSFEVPDGAIVGIIGRNGSGKSTLLKILSRITEPTTGEVEIRGRVGSLLEVGTGFHPELTGRENVFINGAILGMKRVEIARKFDEIVAFADVERFIDTPVKFYSSGMQMRLAFAVAAHLEPEILLVDEVLAVGDAAFQEKCLGKMNEVTRTGRTILLVSHQMNQLRRLCKTAAWFNAGQLMEIGAASQVIGAYEASFRSRDTAARGADGKSHKTAFLSWHIEDGPVPQHVVDHSGPVTVTFRLDVAKHVPRARHGIALLSPEGQNLWGTAVVGLDLPPGIHDLTHTIPVLPLQPVPYYWQVSVYTEGEMIDLWDCLPEMRVTTPPVTHYRDEYAGLLNIASQFAVTSASGDQMFECTGARH
jgi:ABC-type polysaccharide/polyol phosphate transport system ATPase subunit